MTNHDTISDADERVARAIQDILAAAKAAKVFLDKISNSEDAKHLSDWLDESITEVISTIVDRGRL